MWALVIGFFMILVDSTIVSVATPALLQAFDAEITQVMWVTSAYLLAYVVPLLITGRLGDRFGPRRLYLIGLLGFTAASLWCGLAGDITSLILARVAQGLAAALMTPQTMTVITRMFPPHRRGTAMGLWGGIAGLATLVGPILGGLLVTGPGWEWIFIINVPIGVIGFVLAVMWVPRLSSRAHRFDWFGVLLSAVALFSIVFGIQEGETFNWSLPVLGLIAFGVLVLMAFIWWQQKSSAPLTPPVLFRDRNFSLANVCIVTVGFVITAMPIPLVLYFQSGRGLTAAESALMFAPSAVLSGVLAPFVGRYVQSRNPKGVAIFGLSMLAIALLMYAAMFVSNSPLLWMLLPSVLLGFANACMWGPISLTATRNLPPERAGAGSGVYNTTRQVGAVLGSAVVTAVLAAQLVRTLGPSGEGLLHATTPIPPADLAPFAESMAIAILVPAAVALVGMSVAFFWKAPTLEQLGRAPRTTETEAQSVTT
ncbi:DHA2 family efflux MFS transporter permease subunit [Humidisolicoccus flavus]|uniref:DHA2 family efflux MFS transporter permease subunit n=1 Tax=Humidisolicoccus flavus TaxID=3111414 RepID=UPI003253B441